MATADRGRFENRGRAAGNRDEIGRECLDLRRRDAGEQVAKSTQRGLALRRGNRERQEGRQGRGSAGVKAV